MFCETFYQIADAASVLQHVLRKKFVATEANFTHDSRCYRNLKALFTMLIVCFLFCHVAIDKVRHVKKRRRRFARVGGFPNNIF